MTDNISFSHYQHYIWLCYLSIAMWGISVFKKWICGNMCESRWGGQREAKPNCYMRANTHTHTCIHTHENCVSFQSGDTIVVVRAPFVFLLFYCGFFGRDHCSPRGRDCVCGCVCVRAFAHVYKLTGLALVLLVAPAAAVTRAMTASACVPPRKKRETSVSRKTLELLRL